MKQFHSFKSLLFLATVLISACGPTPEEIRQRYMDDKIAVSGLHLDKEILNDYYKEIGTPVSREQLLASLNNKTEATKKIDKIDVVVDMSAGMNIGIDKSYSAITAVMSRFNPQNQNVKYYHVDDDASKMLPISEIKSLGDATYLQNPANYKHSYSKIKPAFESASSSTDKISLVITDFLLDEGVKTDRRLKSGSYTKEETADNSTWAVPYFTKWFAGNNQVIIYPFEYKAKNYYSKDETKFIYYILFVPKGCVNSDLDNLKNDFSTIFKSPIDLNVTNYAFRYNSSEKDFPGTCVSEYNQIKNQGNKPKIFSDYNTLFVPFSHKGIMKAKYIDKALACDLYVENKSPFKLTLATPSYDITKVYYESLQLSKEEWEKGEYAKESFSKGKADNKDVVCDIVNDSSLTFKFSANVGKENYLSKNKGYANLLLSRIMISSMKVKELDSRLSWDFQSKYGTMENSALKESIRLSLDTYVSNIKNVPLGAILFSLHDK